MSFWKSWKDVLIVSSYFLLNLSPFIINMHRFHEVRLRNRCHVSCRDLPFLTWYHSGDLWELVLFRSFLCFDFFVFVFCFLYYFVLILCLFLFRYSFLLMYFFFFSFLVLIIILFLLSFCFLFVCLLFACLCLIFFCFVLFIFVCCFLKTNNQTVNISNYLM